MAVRGCVTLLLFLLSGIVHADDLVTSPLPAAEELSTSKLPVMQTTALPTTSERSATTHTGVTPTTQQKITYSPTSPQQKTINAATVSATTTQETTTNGTTVLPTTTQKTTTNTTTVPATTTQETTTNTTTVLPTTTHEMTTNTTTVLPTTTHEMTTNATTVPPTTMHPNTTNSTTQAPTTTHPNATTAPTPPPTTPPVPNPTVGNYRVKSDNISCLLAKMGLQFSYKSGNGSVQTLNLDPSPNVTEASGTCGIGGNDSSLVLKSKEMTVHFFFTNDSKKFHLHALTFFVGNGSFFNDSNHNLSLWEASFGSSYMCRKEQSYNISDKLTVNTFELQVQPFAVQKDMFGTAEDCKADEPDNFIVPIAVGVALAILVVIVLLAYLIGRKRSQTSGYEQFES
ncbi:hypothetical protein R3I93_015493 [Phoxinus phoxinus]|uniref:Lysosome-associated membrane glycoprotein 2 n=1 Tax=Phoxinus phoxinus TaxID=58324 RepID=A0AAN9H1V0_9TELE